MSWYRDGTISVASGSKAVTGTNTTFNDTAAGVNPGDMIIVGGQFLEVASVNSATSITTVNAATAAITNASYQIVTTLQMSNASLAKKVAAAMDRILLSISNWMLIFKGSGTITITNYDGSTATGLAWPSLTDIAQRSMVVNDAQLTTVNAIMDSNIYTVNAGAAGLPSGISTGGLLENVKYGTTGISQKFKTASATSGQLNREFLRYGVVASGTVTWTTWAESFGSNTIIGLSNGGTGSSNPFGTSAGTFAQGNDSRFSTVNGMTGGTISSAIRVNGALTIGTGFIVKDTTSWATESGSSNGNNITYRTNGPTTNDYSVNDFYVNSGNFWSIRNIMVNNGGVSRVWEMRSDNSFRSPGTVYAAGTALTSDARLKSNFAPVTYDIDVIDKIVPQYYDKRIPDGDVFPSVPPEQDTEGEIFDVLPPPETVRELGIVAQNLQKVLPDLVSSYYWNDKYPDLLSINYSGLSAWLVGYVANLKDLVKAHERTISSLEDRVARLEVLLAPSDQ